MHEEVNKTSSNTNGKYLAKPQDAKSIYNYFWAAPVISSAVCACLKISYPMLSKKEVKYIQSLSDKKNRDSEGIFIAEGPKLVNELLDFGMKAKIVYTTEIFSLKNKDVFEIKTVSEEELQHISHFEKANKMIGIIYKKQLPFYQFENQISLALDGIQDPGNLGTIIRTAHWFNITQIFASLDTADCYNSKVVQSTMGSLAKVNVYYIDIVSFLSSATVPVLGALLNGDNLYKIDKPSEAIVVIGNESKGIRNNILPYIQRAITIPRLGNAESLNAAVATGILLSYLIDNSP